VRMASKIDTVQCSAGCRRHLKTDPLAAVEN
jgi:hypothetical protein